MKLKVLALALLAMLAVATAAEASPKMPFGFARRQTKAWADDYCVHHPSCETWSVGTCARYSRRRVDCWVELEFRHERECTLILENRVSRDGSYYVQRPRQVRCSQRE